MMLDTSFLIDHLRGDRAALDRIPGAVRRRRRALVNKVAVCEVERASDPLEARAFAAIRRASSSSRPGPDAARDAGRWRRAARGEARRSSVADAIIAAEAHHAGAAVLTRNVRDFALTPVRVLTY